MAELKTVDDVGKVNGTGYAWDDLVRAQIQGLADTYTGDAAVNRVLAKWHEDITLGVKRNPNYSPHVNGFYMIWMVHGTWYQRYKNHMANASENNSEDYEGGHATNNSGSLTMSGTLAGNPSTKGNTFNMLATDIDIPDITEEYISVSSRLRNSFMPSRNYFVSDFSISYIENINLEIIRYHEAWMKFLELLKRGEIEMYPPGECRSVDKDRGIFLDMPFSNAVWVAVFQPFTTNIQLLIKLIGVMPVNMPLKQVVGNRSASKMTVLNMQYKAADIQYKFYNGSKEMLEDRGLLVRSFKHEVLTPLTI